MMEISLREFQRNVCKLIKSDEVIIVRNAAGDFLGSWHPPGPVQIGVGQADGSHFVVTANGIMPEVSDKTENLVGQAEPSVKDEIDEVFGPSIDLCYKCHSAGKEVEAKYKGETWLEDGDWATISICEACYKKFKPPKFKLIK